MSTFVQLKNLVVPAPQTLSGFSLQHRSVAIIPNQRADAVVHKA